MPHEDFAWIHPGKRSVVVALKGDVVRIVNWQMVTAGCTRDYLEELRSRFGL